VIGTAGGDSLKIKGDFLRAMHRCRSLPCPAGIIVSEDPVIKAWKAFIN